MRVATPRLDAALTLLLSQSDRRFEEAKHEELLPAEEAVPEFLDLAKQGQETCEAAYASFLAARAHLDRQAFQAYGVEREDWQRAIVSGVPWAVEGKEEMELLRKILFGQAS